jgi:hypothetical protein
MDWQHLPMQKTFAGMIFRGTFAPPLPPPESALALNAQFVRLMVLCEYVGSKRAAAGAVEKGDVKLQHRKGDARTQEEEAFKPVPVKDSAVALDHDCRTGRTDVDSNRDWK